MWLVINSIVGVVLLVAVINSIREIGCYWGIAILSANLIIGGYSLRLT